MKGPKFWGIAGNPIAHSLTPKLFSIVGSKLGIEQAEQVYIEANSIEEFEFQTSDLEGELWLSCTAPLKHSPQERLDVKGPDGVNAINQLRRSGNQWSGTSTDGYGFVSACRHIGVDPAGKVLGIRGGGSAARAIAAAWSAEGGLIIPVQGRRELVSGPWEGSIVNSSVADLAVDLDAEPAGGPSIEMNSKIQVSISYGFEASSDDFAVVMVAAQHLEAWKRLFAPLWREGLPSLEEVLSSL
ncbi:MAG: hypothetical protein CMB66_00725 [Euryarchaeota archaeon]|nr:hypothetical protein [Euryarchaeota archaeon]|tara:strand:- start:3040 stop:3765 length:726 start_codon:yes stop_codon:yes gene_type:complete